MVLSAIDERGNIIPAKAAIKQKNYRCRQCDATLRLRGGHRRQLHFYHLSLNHNCPACNKSEQHMAVQQYLMEKLPFNESALEWQRPEIGRIADVAWIHQSLVFEVQCSHMSVQELQERNHDWQSIGFEVIWILHDMRYNKKMLHPIEETLQGKTFYYTNIDANGFGSVYDQYELCEGRYRRILVQKTIEEFTPQKTATNFVPSLVKKRIEEHCPIFTDDIAGRCLNDKSFARQLIEAENKLLKVLKRRQRHRWLTRSLERAKEEYMGVFCHFLERACRH